MLQYEASLRLSITQMYEYKHQYLEEIWQHDHLPKHQIVFSLEPMTSLIIFFVSVFSRVYSYSHEFHPVKQTSNLTKRAAAYPINSPATIAPVDKNCLTGQYCSMQRPTVDKIYGISDSFTGCTVLSSTRKASWL